MVKIRMAWGVKAMKRFASIAKVLWSIERQVGKGGATSDVFAAVAVVTKKSDVKKACEDWDLPPDCNLFTLPDLPDVMHRPAIILFDLDSFQDFDSAIEPLLKFRHTFPSIPVVVFSASFKCDDTGTERLQIADCSMKWPFGFERIEKYRADIIENNAIWVRRALSL